MAQKSRDRARYRMAGHDKGLSIRAIGSFGSSAPIHTITYLRLQAIASMHTILPFLLAMVAGIVLLKMLANKLRVAFPILLVLAGLLGGRSLSARRTCGSASDLLQLPAAGVATITRLSGAYVFPSYSTSGSFKSPVLTRVKPLARSTRSQSACS